MSSSKYVGIKRELQNLENEVDTEDFEAIREQYGLDTTEEEEKSVNCFFCGTENESHFSECRTCGRPLSVREESGKEEKQAVLERLSELENKGVLDKLGQLEW